MDKKTKVAVGGTAIGVAAGLFLLLWKVLRESRTSDEVSIEEQMDVGRTAKNLDTWYIQLTKGPSISRLVKMVSPLARDILKRHTKPNKEEP